LKEAALVAQPQSGARKPQRAASQPSRTRRLAIVATLLRHRDRSGRSGRAAPATRIKNAPRLRLLLHTTIFVRVAQPFFSCDKSTIPLTETQMATLEAFRAVLDDKGTPEIIRNHIIDSLQYALRNHGQIFTSKEVEWLAGWDDARIPLAASRELQKRVAETSR
jgi:hypothetical protein